MPALDLENGKKGEWIGLRVEPSRKELYQRAAAINGQALAQWALERLDAAAARDIAEPRALSLPDAAFDQLCELLDGPLPPETRELLDREAVWAR